MRNSMKWVAVFGLSATVSASLLYAQNEGAVEALLADLAGGNDGDVELVDTNKVEDVASEAKGQESQASEAVEAAPAVTAAGAAAAVVTVAVAEEKVDEVATAAAVETAAPAVEPAEVVEEAAVVVEAPAAETAAPAVEEPAEAVAAASANEKTEVVTAVVVDDEDESTAVVVAPALDTEKDKVSAVPVETVGDDAALISELEELETIRIRALDEHGHSTIEVARKAMKEKDYEVAAAQYQKSLEFLGDRPQNTELRKEACEGVAESHYRLALRMFDRKNYEQAKILAVKAIDEGHDRAGRLLEAIKKAMVDEEKTAPKDSIVHRVNESDYKDMRSEIRTRLRRSRQLLATGEYSKALEQCELVLRDYPDTREAVDLRARIAQKMKTFSDVEFETTRTMMIRDVRDTWNTRRYAIDSAEVPKGKMEMTTKRQAGEIASGRTAEQVVQQKLEEIVLPEVSFRPPATIIDAVTFFDNAAREYDKPDLPMSERGVNIVLKLPNQNAGAAAAVNEGANEDDPFAASAGASSGASADGVPVIPALSARFITLKNALKLVCDVTGMKSLIRGNVVMVVPQNEPDTELLTRSYNVLASLTDRISSAQSEMGNSKKGDEQFMETADMSAKQDWKNFFGELGVQWPEGSSIAYISTIGKLRVKNTAENLAVFEQVLEDLNVTPRLIEIEARFVDVSQEDLNSLGFEWLINTDFTMNLGGWLGKHLKNVSGANSTANALGYSNITTVDGDSKTTYTDVKLLGDAYENSSYMYADRGDGTFVRNLTFPTGLNTPSTIGNTVQSTYLPYQKLGKLTSTRLAYNDSMGRPLYQWNNGTIHNYAAVDGQYGIVNASKANASINAIDGKTYSSGMRYLSSEGNHIAGQGNSINDQFMRVNAFLGNADISMILHMLAQRNDTDLLNAPRVVTKNGQEAIMKVVTEYIYPTEYDVEISQNGSSSGTTSGNSADPIATVEPQNFEMREVGTILQVVPEVSPEGQMINLLLNPQVVSEPTWKNYGTQLPKTIYRAKTLEERLADPLTATEQVPETGYIDLPMEQPFFSVRSVSTQLSVYNGATVVIGGLITEVRKAMEDKIPFLGDIPYIGRLFRSKSEMSQKRNLLIFITAKLVDPSGKVIKPSEDSALLQNAEGSADVGAGNATAAPAAAGVDEDDDE